MNGRDFHAEQDKLVPAPKFMNLTNYYNEIDEINYYKLTITCDNCGHKKIVAIMKGITKDEVKSMINCNKCGCIMNQENK